MLAALGIQLALAIGAGSPAQSKVGPMLRELRAGDETALAVRLQAVLRAEQELVDSFRRRLAEAATRAEALLEIEADDRELAAAARAALPAGQADEATVSLALAPWVERYVTRAVDGGIKQELGRLSERCTEAERSILRLAPNDSPIARAAKEEDARRWDESRRRALGAIFDLALYPDQDHGKAGQAEIDRRVGAAWSAYKAMVVRIEDDLAALFKKKPEEWRTLLDGQVAARRALEEACPLVAARPGVRARAPAADDSARMRQARGLLLTFLGRLTEAKPLLAESGLYGSELVRHVRVQLVLDSNAEDLATNPRDKEEDKAERWINEYRVALGLLPLEHDPRLYACARGHSAEMNELHYYGHESPKAEHKTFVERARLAGYPEAKVGECILQGAANWSGIRAARAWYGSSTHHRLLLSEDFCQIGVAQVGPYYTANFGAWHAPRD